MGSLQNSLSIPRARPDLGTEESELVSLLAPRHIQAIDHAASRSVVKSQRRSQNSHCFFFLVTKH